MPRLAGAYTLAAALHRPARHRRPRRPGCWCWPCSARAWAPAGRRSASMRWLGRLLSHGEPRHGRELGECGRPHRLGGRLDGRRLPAPHRLEPRHRLRRRGRPALVAAIAIFAKGRLRAASPAAPVVPMEARRAASSSDVRRGHARRPGALRRAYRRPIPFRPWNRRGGRRCSSIGPRHAHEARKPTPTSDREERSCGRSMK